MNLFELLLTFFEKYGKLKSKFFYDNTQYLFAVKYTWQAGSGGDKIAYSKYLNGYYTFLDGENPHTEIIFPSSAYSDKTYCPPSYPYYRTYNSAQDYYSADYKTIDPNDDNFSLESVSDIHCKRTPKEYLSTAKADYMPTSYDETGFIWYHEGASKQIIVATIVYKNICYNIQVTIPGIGYKKTSVTIYNVTFYLRTGPSRCSIKVSKGDVLRSDVNFAFGVVNKGNDVFSQFNFV